MAKTRDYMDYLDDRIKIAPATSQEEYQAAKTIANVLRDHHLETSIEEFDAYPMGVIFPAILVLIMFVCLIVAKFTSDPVRIVALLISLFAAGLTIFVHYSGSDLFRNFGPSASSQNVVAVHRATGSKVVKGARPIVIVAHYDTPREDLLRKGPLARYQSALRIASIFCHMVVAVTVLLQILPFVPETLKTVMWVIGLIAMLPLLILAVADIYSRFSPYTPGSNDNKSSLAALLAIANKVRPTGDRVDEEIEKAGANRSKRRRAKDAPPEPPAPQRIEIVEEVKGVRHGRAVLESLGILPPDCEIVYEEPRVQVVEQVAVDVISDSDTDAAESVAQVDGFETDEVPEDNDLQSSEDLEESESDSQEIESEDSYEPEEEPVSRRTVRLEEQEDEWDENETQDEEYEDDDQYEEDYDEEDAFDEDEESYEEDELEEDYEESDDESYEDDEYDEEELEEEYEEDFEEDTEKTESPSGGALKSVGSWFTHHLSDVKDYLSRKKPSEIDEDEDDEDFDESDDEETYEEEYEEESYDEDNYDEEEYTEEETYDEEYEEDEDEYDDETDEDDLTEDESEEQDEEYEEELVEEDEASEEYSSDDESYDESDGEYEDESEEEYYEEDYSEEDEYDDSSEEYDEEDYEDYDEFEAVEDEESSDEDYSDEDEEYVDDDLDEEEYSEEYDEEDYDEEYDEYSEEDYEYEEQEEEEPAEDYEPKLTFGERVSNFFKKIRIREEDLPSGDEEYEDDEFYAQNDARDEYEDENDYEDEVFEEAYDESDHYDEPEIVDTYGTDVYTQTDKQEYAEEEYEEMGDEPEDMYYAEEYDDGEYDYDYDESEYVEADYDFEDVQKDEASAVESVDESEDQPVVERLVDPNELHFDREEDADVLPKDITGIDVISDSYDLYTEETARSGYEKPEPLTDPGWGVSSYQPARPAMNIARRAALFDLPDPSSLEMDPFEDDYEEYDDEYDEYEEVETQVESQVEEEVKEEEENQVVVEEPTPEPVAAEPVADEVKAPAVPEQTSSENSRKNFWGSNDNWKGGAAVRDDLRADDAPIVIDADDLQDAILELGDEFLIAHDIWFVATGASNVNHAGMRAFMENHKRDIRKAFLMNLECVGAGSLSVVIQEGLSASRRADRRLVRMITSIAQDLHIQLDNALFNWGESDAATSMRSRIRSVTIAGLDENVLPAYSHTSDDVPENVDPRQVSDTVRIVTELIRRA